ncbi:MAG TPA: hypothetical protein VGO45_01780 [Bacteroidia bacterium]|jgi:hypothetical protein|nr:hypothetical protein [Bacteroidia bacterium]
MKRGLIFLCLAFVCSSLAAQTDTTFNSKKEIVIKGKRFRVYNNWMNVGLGEGLNTRLPFTQTILDVDLHFHIRDSYFQLGTFLSGDRFLSFNNYNAHFCYGKRWETETRNIFVSAGPSYSWGFPYSNGVYNSYIYTAFGGYAEAQYIFKPAYDLGLGLSVFGDFNYLQAVYGIRVELFFSGAYRGEKNKRY